MLKSLLNVSPGISDTEITDGHGMSGEALAKAFVGVDVVLGDFTFRHRIGPDLVADAERVKLIQQPSVGYEHIDIKACTDRRIPVANTPGANTVSVAEHTIAFGWPGGATFRVRAGDTEACLKDIPGQVTCAWSTEPRPSLSRRLIAAPA